VSLRTRGVFALSALLLMLLLGACGRVEIDVPDLSASDRKACADLVDELPDTLFGEVRRSVSPDDAPGAAWGDDGDPVMLTCGVDVPAGYDEFSPCVEFRDGGDVVGWFVPDAQQQDSSGPLTATALTVSPRVELLIPGPYRQRGVDGALSDLAGPLTSTLTAAEPCS